MTMTNFKNKQFDFGNKILKIRYQISEIRVQKTDLRGQSIELIRGLIKGHRVWCVTIGNVRWHLVEIHDNWCVPWSVRYKSHLRIRMSRDPWPSFFFPILLFTFVREILTSWHDIQLPRVKQTTLIIHPPTVKQLDAAEYWSPVWLIFSSCISV